MTDKCVLLLWPPGKGPPGTLTSPLQWERLFSWADATHSCRDPPVVGLGHSKEKPLEPTTCASFSGRDQMRGRGAYWRPEAGVGGQGQF